MSGQKKEVDYRKQKAKSRVAWGVAIFFAVFWLLVALIPFVFMILNSFRKQFDMLSQGVFHFPDPWFFENYPNIVKNGFFGYFFRSVLVVVVSLLVMLIISAFAALVGISAVQNEIQIPWNHLCGYRGYDVHSHACYPDPDL